MNSYEDDDFEWGPAGTHVRWTKVKVKYAIKIFFTVKVVLFCSQFVNEKINHCVIL
jgi:hypothetical protein